MAGARGWGLFTTTTGGGQRVSDGRTLQPVDAAAYSIGRKDVMESGGARWDRRGRFASSVVSHRRATLDCAAQPIATRGRKLIM